MEPTARTYGLIGRRLGHSSSAAFFAEKFKREGLSNCKYVAIEADLNAQNLREAIHALAEKNHLMGFNVTFPYKELILGCLDQLSPEAAQIGAANCVRVDRLGDGRYALTGHNTDALGFEESLPTLTRQSFSHALVLGTGGASKAVCHALRKMGIAPQLVSRTPERFGANPGTEVLSYPAAYRAAQNIFLIVNATPVGTFPDCAMSPWNDWSAITPRHYCYDLVYNPEQTLFLRQAATHGAKTQNGLAMLHKQAELSWEFWNKSQK